MYKEIPTESQNIFIKTKPLEYFINSPLWDAEISGGSFNYLYPTDELDPNDEYSTTSVITWEVSVQGIKEASLFQGELGHWELHQDNRWYFESYHSDMIETIYTRKDYPEMYL